MQAANEGAASSGRRARTSSVGVRIDLPFEQDVNPFVEQAFTHRTFFTRLHHFVLTSDAFIVVPGGIGTVLETMLIWQLLQVRHVDDVPLILIGDLWRDLVSWVDRHMLRGKLALISPEDLRIPVCLRTADEAIAVVRKHHLRWQRRHRRR
jgi:predicted Rossmann-fold nucleotide-binding protein